MNVHLALRGALALGAVGVSIVGCGLAGSSGAGSGPSPAAVMAAAASPVMTMMPAGVTAAMITRGDSVFSRQRVESADHR